VSDGYYLQNYQNDTYANCDTVEWRRALDLVRAIIDSGVWPDHVQREIDR
jgi:hypothetical protein